MRPRCTSHDPDGHDSDGHDSDGHDSDGHEPVLTGPAHAASAIRLSAPPAEGPAIVVLLCDRDHRLLLAVAVEGATPDCAGRVVDLVLAVAESAGVSGIVVGIVRERLGQYLTKPETASFAGLVARCKRADVALLDVLLVGPRGWRSIHNLAAEPGGDEDDNQ